MDFVVKNLYYLIFKDYYIIESDLTLRWYRNKTIYHMWQETEDFCSKYYIKNGI